MAEGVQHEVETPAAAPAAVLRPPGTSGLGNFALGRARPADVLALQRTAGNAATGAVLRQHQAANRILARGRTKKQSKHDRKRLAVEKRGGFADDWEVEPRVQVRRFHVEVTRASPSTDDGGSASDDDGPFAFKSSMGVGWQIHICVDFESDNPSRWGEFRAYAGLWSSDEDSPAGGSFMYGTTLEELVRVDREARESLSSSDVYNRRKSPPTAATAIPWGLGAEGQNEAGELIYLENDQHMNVVYQRAVPGVPRSQVGREAEGDESPYFGDVEPAEWTPTHIGKQALAKVRRDRENHHIVVSDEPSATAPASGEFNYIHRAHYEIRDPVDGSVVFKRGLRLEIWRRQDEYDDDGPIQQEIRHLPA